MSWIEEAAGLPAFDPEARQRLAALSAAEVAPGTVLFRPGEAARGFVVVLAGRIDVFLTGPSGREVLLYSVAPGQSCVQSTLGLLGGADYTGEAVAAAPSRIVLIPRETFLALMDRSAAFRGFVFAAFAARMQATMQALERVAFGRIEGRLAQALLALAEGGIVRATHQDLAARVGTAREVVTRRLVALEEQGLVRTGRGIVHIADRGRLERLAASPDLA